MFNVLYYDTKKQLSLRKKLCDLVNCNCVEFLKSSTLNNLTKEFIFNIFKYNVYIQDMCF